MHPERVSICWFDNTACKAHALVAIERQVDPIHMTPELAVNGSKCRGNGIVSEGIVEASAHLAEGNKNMALIEIQTTMMYPIEDVFALTVNLEQSPRWHSIFTDIYQLTPNPIGLGSRWKIGYVWSTPDKIE